jgi:hypothetical protein
VAVVPNFGKDGARLNKFSFEVHFTPQTHINVRPAASVEYDDGSGKLKYLMLKWDDFEREGRDGDRTRLTYDFKTKQGNPLKVRRIAIGGSEKHIPGKVLPGVAVPDFTIARFVAEDGSSGILSNNHILDIGEREKLDRVDPIFSDLLGTPNK